AFSRRYARSALLVTFNGKAFDMTMIRERAAFHGVPLPRQEPPHLDLLQEARRLWRGRVPDCRLVTLEQCLCQRSRIGDIPGWAIPEAYHRFVDTGDARELSDILHHNLLDLLTMAELLCAVLTGADAPSD
ncbi:MAG: ribonuclease H-like domain-containing protein, partial [Phycisphaerae bacterium]|nr:ribonuclease H-like domain-containing protein [Phycisphaerae bacterium]